MIWELTPLSVLFAAQAFTLLLVCGLLLVHIRKRKRFTRQLEEKITDLRVLAGTSRRHAKDALKALEAFKATPPKRYLDFIDEQLENSKSHHEGLNPDRDIVLDIEPEASLERRIASLRYAFLLAEKEAGTEKGVADWVVFQDKLEKIIEFYGLHADTDTSEATLTFSNDGHSPNTSVDESLNAESHSLEQEDTAELSLSDEDRARLEKLVRELTDEGKKMLSAIAGLENENRQLKNELEDKQPLQSTGVGKPSDL